MGENLEKKNNCLIFAPRRALIAKKTIMDTSIIEIIRTYFMTQPIVKAWIFGSFSRGEQRQDSDVDILVQYDRQSGPVGLFKVISIQQRLQQLLGRKIDLVEDGTLMPFAADSANHDKILIYERGN